MSKSVAQSIARSLRPLTYALLLATLSLTVSGCSGFAKTTGPGEFGVIFTALPTWLGGGIGTTIVRPGETKLLFPWETLYTLDTSVQTLSWGTSRDEGDEGHLETRTLDGNEVGLSITVLYHVDPAKVGHVIQRVASSNDDIRQIVAALARADIRTYLNALRTRDFISQSNKKNRDQALEVVRGILRDRLEEEGIIVDSVIYRDHRFERKLSDGTVDQSYQDQVELTQATYQEAEQEKKKIKTVEEQKKRELSEADAVVNRQVEEAIGFKRQASLRGDAYYKVKENESTLVEAKGMAEVAGLRDRLEALAGEGGQTLMRLEMVRALVRANPKFAVVNTCGDGQSGQNSLGVNKVDTNQLLDQIGVFTALSESSAQRKEVKSDEALHLAPTDAVGKAGLDASKPAPLSGSEMSGSEKAKR